ncbi:MAG TPA: glycosyltransferase family 2 protein [Gammaproteobacteria bacterium]|nr:MAG: hypothetical protein A3E83_06660 [Gammaproteobacteria bacterium RIFCSPHIGHO2_12_FULL_41_20]HLB43560.1 glycosyltransferase family 2 protein [Gammaproteobacteria bacterium]
MEKITALIPTYRRPQLLHRAIVSVLRQTYTNLQVFVFDNASGDMTEKVVDVLKKTDDRVFYHCHPVNVGALKNFKFAFQSINTPYFSILSDDDALSFKYYEQAIQVLEQYPDIMFVILNTLSIDENADLIGNQENEETLKLYRAEDRPHVINIPSTWTSILFKKEVAKLYLEMDDRFDIASDMRFLGLAKARYNFAHLSKVGAFFTCHQNSISSNRKRFDIVHHAIQISRYIEIYHHPEIDQPIKKVALFSIKEMLKSNKYKSFLTFIETLKIAIKKCCDHTNLDNSILINEIQDAKNSGFIISAFFLQLIYRNKIISSIVRYLFSGYYEKLKRHHKMKMSRLQNGIYKKIFDELKSITTNSGKDMAALIEENRRLHKELTIARE